MDIDTQTNIIVTQIKLELSKLTIKVYTKLSCLNIAKNKKEQGLGVGPGSVTECWPFRKRVRKSVLFRKKIKIT